MTREDLRERIIERAAQAEHRLYSGEDMTPDERQQAEQAIERALRAMDYSEPKLIVA